MSEVEIQKIITYLKSFGKPSPTCEICENDQWGVNQHIVSPFPFGSKWSPVVYPQFMIYCTKCGNTKYISAVRSQILVSVPEEPEPVFEPQDVHEVADG